MRRALVLLFLLGVVLALVLLRAGQRDDARALPDTTRTATSTDAELRDPAEIDAEDATRAAEPEPPLAREAAAMGEARVTIHGLVTAAASGAPLPAGFALDFDTGAGAPLRVRLESGAFEVSCRDPAHLAARVTEQATHQPVDGLKVHRYADERAPDGSWPIAVACGWFAFLELSGSDERATRALLIDRSSAGELVWARPTLLGRDRPFVSLPELEAPTPSPGARRFLQIRAERDGEVRAQGEVEISVHAGVQPEPVRVELSASAGVRGRVLDERGEPWKRASVTFLPRTPRSEVERDPWCQTDGAGVFALKLWTGSWRVIASTELGSHTSLEVEIAPGDNELGDIRLPRGSASGSIRGRVREADGVNERALTRLTLRERASGAELHTSTGTLESEFEFDNVPAGNYELSIESFDGRTFSPPSVEVSPPADGLEFRAGPSAEIYSLRVESARTGLALPDAGVLASFGPSWVPCALGDGGLPFRPPDESWILARGYAPARLARSDFTRTDDGVAAPALFAAAVALEPGFGQAVFVADAERCGGMRAPWLWPEGAALARVRILADGREVGRTDDGGFALVALEKVPERLACELAGYATVRTDVRGAFRFVWMARE